MKNNKFFKKSIIAVGLISSSLFGNNVNLDDVIEQYKTKNYSASYSGFKEYENYNILDKTISFMYARSAFEIGKYEDALYLYERVLLEDPDNLRSRLEIARCYLHLKQYEKAKEQFTLVLNDNIPTTVRNNVLANLKKIEMINKQNIIKTSLMAGFVYDSNINNDADFYSTVSGGVPLTGGGASEDDSSLQLALNLNHKYKINESNFLENNIAIFTQQYFENSNKNLDVLSLNSKFVNFDKTKKISLGFTFNHVKYGSDTFMNIFSVSPEYSINLSKQLNYTTNLNYSANRYTQEINNDRDANLFSYANSLTYSTKDYGNFISSLNLGKELRLDGTRTDIANNFYDLSLKNNLPLSKTLLLNSSLAYKNTSYKYNDAVFLTKREDKQFKFETSLIKMISKNFSIAIGANYTSQDSNHEPYTYDKYTMKSNLYYSF